MLVINRGCEKWGFEPDAPQDCPLYGGPVPDAVD
jgi:hypothetical protein